jgi:hypothetical protein
MTRRIVALEDRKLRSAAGAAIADLTSDQRGYGGSIRRRGRSAKIARQIRVIAVSHP